MIRDRDSLGYINLAWHWDKAMTNRDTAVSKKHLILAKHDSSIFNLIMKKWNTFDLCSKNCIASGQ